MKRKMAAVVLLVLVTGLGFGAGYADPIPMVNNGDGLIYDPNLNITWYDYYFNGYYTNAVQWEAALTVDRVTGWRLPVTPGLIMGNTDEGLQVSDLGDMGYLYYEDLHNTPNSGLANKGPFTHLSAGSWYWTGTQTDVFHYPAGICIFDFNSVVTPRS